MPQQQSPWLEGAYGWNFGEGGWNAGMDSNLLKFSFMFDRNVDSITASLPSAVNGQAHYLTTDNRLYFAVGSTYFSTLVPKWFEFKIRSNGATYQFNGSSAIQIDTPSELDVRLDAVELTVASLGTAAFEDIEFFASQAELDVVEASAQSYTDVLRQDLADKVDPLKNASLVAWKRQSLLDDLDKVSTGLNSSSVNVWEFADLIVSKPNPLDSETWDWSPAVQAACDLCNSTFPARPLAISTMCRLASPIVINRPIDGDLVRDTFTILGMDGGGFIVTSNMAMFTSTLPPTNTGTPPQPSPVSQTVRLQNLVLTCDDPARTAYVFDGNKFLRVWVVGCDISKIRFADTSSYQQSIYFIANNIRYWQGMFFRATGGCYDVRFAPGNLVEQGEDFIEMLGQTSDKDVTGCSIDGSCIEGLTGTGIRYAHARGVSITNNYFEANAGPDIISNDFPSVTNRGITHSGNMHALSAANKVNPLFYPVAWGKTLGGVSSGNTSDGNLNTVRPDTQTVFSDHAVGIAVSDSSRAAPGNIMYGTVSPQINNAVYGGRAWAAGNIVINTNPGVTLSMGWICAVAGTPGTWYPMGPVAQPDRWSFADTGGLEQAQVIYSGNGAGQTSLAVRGSDGVTDSIRRILIGPVDSGGAGFRALRIDN